MLHDTKGGVAQSTVGRAVAAFQVVGVTLPQTHPVPKGTLSLNMEALNLYKIREKVDHTIQWV